MSYAKDKKRKLHGQGIAFENCHKPFEVPPEYRGYIDVLSDVGIETISFKRRRTGGRWGFEMEGPRAFVATEDVDTVIGIAGGKSQITIKMLRMLAKYGADGLRSMTIAQLEEEGLVGPKTLEALVAFGVEDTRKKRCRHVSGTFYGTIDGQEVKGHIEGRVLAGPTS